MDVIRLSRELEGDSEAEAKVVVPVRRLVVVAIGGAAVLRFVVPAAAAIHTVVALAVFDHCPKSTLSLKFLVCACSRNASNGSARRWHTDSGHKPLS